MKFALTPRTKLVSGLLALCVAGSAFGQLLIEGERQIGTEYRELSAENHIANLEKTFKEWGTRVRKFMNVAHSRSE
jgi:hypothetical protein